jgi:urease accessory protein
MVDTKMRDHLLNELRLAAPRRLGIILATLVLFNTSAFAHTTPDKAHGFITGFLHPLSGLDHVLAMLAVGIWGTQLKKPAMWILPVAFPLVMSLGGLLGIRGVPIFGVDIGVAASDLVLGSAIALELKWSLWVAASIVSVFAIFHGYAHGLELPKAVAPLTFALGFVLSTGLLHTCGILIGLVDVWPVGKRMLRTAGGFIALMGLFLLAVAVTHA